MKHKNVLLFTGSPTLRIGFVVEARRALAASLDAWTALPTLMTEECAVLTPSQVERRMALPPPGIGLVFLAVICKATVGYRYRYPTVANFVVVQ